MDAPAVATSASACALTLLVSTVAWAEAVDVLLVACAAEFLRSGGGVGSKRWESTLETTAREPREVESQSAFALGSALIASCLSVPAGLFWSSGRSAREGRSSSPQRRESVPTSGETLTRPLRTRSTNVLRQKHAMSMPAMSAKT